MSDKIGQTIVPQPKLEIVRSEESSEELPKPRRLRNRQSWISSPLRHRRVTQVVRGNTRPAGKAAPEIECGVEEF
jgi:hypothetical protein